LGRVDRQPSIGDSCGEALPEREHSLADGRRAQSGVEHRGDPLPDRAVGDLGQRHAAEAGQHLILHRRLQPAPGCRSQVMPGLDPVGRPGGESEIAAPRIPPGALGEVNLDPGLGPLRIGQTIERLSMRPARPVAVSDPIPDDGTKPARLVRML
jgi:hypothetical protein